MMLLSILRGLGFPTGAAAPADAKAAGSAIGGITAASTADQTSRSSGSDRRHVVKAATRKTVSAAPAGTAAARAQGGTPAAANKAPATPSTPKAAAKPAAKTAAPSKAAGKAVAKPSAKAPVKVAAKVTKPVAKAVAKPVNKAPAKPTGSTKTVGTTKAKVEVVRSSTTAAKSKAKVNAAPINTKAAPAKAKPAKPAVASKVLVPKAPAKAPAPKVAAPAKVAAVPAPKPTAPLTAPAKKAAPAVAAPSDLPKVGATIETPQPLGKRAAKKVMMEQMSQPEVLPTHAPDAAKATFSAPHERVVIMPTAQAFAVKKDLKRVDNWKKLSLDALTDADILAMPDSEYMNDVQLAFFRRKLSALKADMLANAGETTEHLREDTVVVPDPADRATIEEEHALELRTRDRERKLLKKIEQSISRIDANDYGYCDETGEPIGVPRLLARPTASLSLEAQQRRELKQKMFGD